MMLLLVATAELAKKRHVYLAEHVKDGERRAQQEKAPNYRVTVSEGLPDDLVLGHETREGRHPGERQGRDQEGDECDWHLVAQATYFAHVLLAAHRVDDRAGAEKQTGLEERV